MHSIAPDQNGAGASSPRLDALDDALVGVRRVLQRPGYRRRLLEGEIDLELGTLRLLRAVQRCGDTAPSIGDVADVLAIDPSTASRVVERAVAAGHLDRHACQDDRRRTRLVLTAEGRRALDRVTARRRELLARITTSWDPADVDRLVASLGALLHGFDVLEDEL